MYCRYEYNYTLVAVFGFYVKSKPLFTFSYFHKLDASFINVQNKKFKERDFTFFISLWNIQSLNADNLIKDHTSTSAPEIPCQLSSNMDIEEDSLSRYKDLEKTKTVQ